MGTQFQKIQENSLSSYIPRGQNVLQQIFKDHFDDEKYAGTYGNYRIDRISEVVEDFLKCRDYSKGLAMFLSLPIIKNELCYLVNKWLMKLLVKISPQV